MTWCSSTGQTSIRPPFWNSSSKSGGSSTGWTPSAGDVMPTDKQVLVRWGDYDAAKEISSQVKLQVEKERAVGDGEEYEEMPPKKRIVVQIVSVFFFILLIMLAVYGTDAIANWLKGLFG